MNKYLKYGLHALILIGLGIASFKYLKGENIWQALTSFAYPYLPFILMLATLYFLIKAWRFHIFLTPFSKTKRFTVMRAYLAGQAATIIPGGIAARIGLLKQAGVPVEASSVPVAFSSIADQTLFIVSALIATIFFEPARLPAYIFLAGLTLVGGLLLLPIIRTWLNQFVFRLAKHFKVDTQLARFFDNVSTLFRPAMLFWTLALTLLSLLLEIVALDLVLRGVGQPVAYANLALAYVLPTMLGRLSGLPAGLGVTEAGMVGFLSTYSGLDAGTASAATLIFRICTAFFRVLVGALSYAFAWKGEKERAHKYV